MITGKDLKERRESLGLTLDQVAEMVGVSYQTVWKWESGVIDNMKRNSIAGLSEALKVDPLWIIGLKDTPEMEVSNNYSEDELVSYFNENMHKFDKLTKEERRKLIDLIDVYLE